MRVVDGSYDDAVRLSAELADERRLVLSDTSWPGYEEIPGWVIDGYATIFHEVDAQAPAPVDVAFVPIGVGALAAAAARHLAGRARLAGVEPVSAACVLESARAGEITEVPGPHPSIMAGLNAGLPSLVAWPYLSGAFELFCRRGGRGGGRGHAPAGGAGARGGGVLRRRGGNGRPAAGRFRGPRRARGGAGQLGARAPDRGRDRPRDVCADRDLVDL